MVSAKWTGDYPNLCSGKWILIVDGKDVSDKIPDELRSNIETSNVECIINGMNTYKEYCEYGEDEEDISYYEDGLKCNEWIEANAYWLDTITTNYRTQIDIYEAINEQDWRRDSCGGCI